jgi:ABC-type lipoprotein export system ATPase subunit
MPSTLTIAALRFGYGRGFELRVAGLEVAAGEHVLLRGPSGCGKSTLLHLVAGLEQPAAGSITVAGIDITTLSAPDRDSFRGRHVGMVFQTFNLLQGFTALENVMVGLEFSAVPASGRAHQARQALASLGISECDARIDEMSIGQQQRVAIARAVAGGPALVLADEPTASLDPANSLVAISTIRDAARRVGAALLCTSHDPSLAPHFDRVLDMTADGTLAAEAQST